MALQIDFHSHVLPGLDHGSRDLKTSLQQLLMVREGHTDVLVATPHFYPHRMNLARFLAQREESVKLLCDNMDCEDGLRVVVGTETACYPGLENMDGLETLCIAGTNCLLLEMPMTEWKEAHFETVDAIITELTIFALSVIPFFVPPAIVLTVAGAITWLVMWIVRRKKKK